MRRTLVFSDLHANRRALDDIIPVLREASLSVFCGDLLGYGTDINACIEFVLNKIDLVVLGNHERLALTSESLDKQYPVVRESVQYVRSKLTTEQKRMLSSVPTEIWHEDMYITHSIGDEYLRTEKDFMRLCHRMREETKYAFFGHTHQQVLFKYNNKTIINPGSITKGRRGFPRSYVTICGDTVSFKILESNL